MATELGGKRAHQGEAKRALAHIWREANTVILDADPEATIGGLCDAHEDFAGLPVGIGVLEGVRDRFVDQEGEGDCQPGLHHDVISHDMQDHTVGKCRSQGLRECVHDIREIDGTMTRTVAVKKLVHSAEHAKTPCGVLQSRARVRCAARARLQHQQRRNRLDRVLDSVVGLLNESHHGAR